MKKEKVLIVEDEMDLPDLNLTRTVTRILPACNNPVTRAMYDAGKRKKGDRGMECPYLEKGMFRPVCNASVTLLTPDTEGIEGYCTTEENYRCPMLLAHFLRAGRKNGAASRSLN